MASWFPVTDHPHLLHAAFEALAISAGAVYYRIEWRRTTPRARSPLAGDHFWVLMGCILGAALGNKLVFWATVPHLLPAHWNTPALWFGGQSIVGGLLGGLIGVELAKKWAGVRRSTGDIFVFPILLGLIIGRIGCFLAGLEDGTYGLPTNLPWGIDLGEGIPRHPAPLYEILLVAALWWLLHRLQPIFAPQPGLLFKTMLCSYLLWRLLIDTLKPLPFDYGLGLSGIQVICLLALAIYLPLSLLQWRNLSRVRP